MPNSFRENVMKRNFVLSVMENPPTIYCDRIYLRKLNMKDAKDVFEYSSDPEVTKYLTWEPHVNFKSTVSYLKSVEKAYAAGEFYDWGIVLKPNGKLVGTCGITSFDFEKESIEVGYVLNPRYEGYGIMTEALNSVISFCFNTLGAKKVMGRFMAENEKSKKVLERCGMKFDGVSKKPMFYKNRYIDIGTCSLLKE